MYKYVIGLIGIFLVALVTIEFIQFRIRLSHSQELIKTNDPFSVHPENPRNRILVIGDSTARGVGALEPVNSIAGRLHEDFPQSEIVNVGETGLKTYGLREKIGDFSCEKFDLIVIQIGANDIVRFTRLFRMQDALDDILKTATSCSSEVMLLTSANVGTAPIFSLPLQWAYTRRTLQVREIFMQKAKEHGVIYVDLFQSPQDDPFAQHPEVHYASDDFHPSDEGYGVWYRKIKSALNSVSL